MNRRLSLDSRRLAVAEIVIKHAAGVVLAACAFIVLGWVAGF